MRHEFLPQAQGPSVYFYDIIMDAIYLSFILSNIYYLEFFEHKI